MGRRQVGEEVGRRKGGRMQEEVGEAGRRAGSRRWVGRSRERWVGERRGDWTWGFGSGDL